MADAGHAAFRRRGGSAVDARTHRRADAVECTSPPPGPRHRRRRGRPRRHHRTGGARRRRPRAIRTDAGLGAGRDSDGESARTAPVVDAGTHRSGGLARSTAAHNRCCRSTTGSQLTRIDGGAALGEWALRYFRSHGPATVDDFVWGRKLTVRQARAGLASAAERLERIVVDGSTTTSTGDARSARGASSTGARVFLLPGFDEFILGYRDRGAAVDPAFQPRLQPGNNGMFSPPSSRTAGWWARGNGVAVAPAASTPRRSPRSTHARKGDPPGVFGTGGRTPTGSRPRPPVRDRSPRMSPPCPRHRGRRRG